MENMPWAHVVTTKGTIDEMLKITAAPGEISVSGGKPPYSGWTLTFPCDAVDILIERLTRARDAAALMAAKAKEG